MPVRSGRRVVVVGGGVAGLSAAHELVRRGFDVEVYERHRRFGGKARSTYQPFQSPNANGARQDIRLPTEHGFRFFPGFYRHIIDTMENIKTPEGSVADHLVAVDELRFFGNANTNPSPGILPIKPVWYPSAFFRWVGFLPSVLKLAPGKDGRSLTAGDIGFFAARFWTFLITCQERREAELEGLPWFEFLQSNQRSDAFQKYLGIGLTRNLVACKADKASTLTVGTIGLQIILDVLYGIFYPRRVDRVLDGPTNDVWIDPWVADLRNRGVQFHEGMELTKIDVDRDQRRIEGLHFNPTDRDRAKQQRICEEVCREPSETGQAAQLQREGDRKIADHYIFAIPIEQMSTFITADLRKAAPSWGLLPALAKSVDWMNGIMFYLTRQSELRPGHIDYLDSDWALTSIFQDKSLWKKWGQYIGQDREIQQILSVDISDWTGLRTTGRYAGSAASQMDRASVIDAVWEQVKEALVGRHGYEIADANKKYAYVDDDITDARKQVTFVRSIAAQRLRAQGGPPPPRPELLSNAEPLLVNRIHTRRLRPSASGDLANAYLASDYVRTTTDLATMEGANEAARRAVNEILAQEGREDFCRLFPMREPLGFLRSLDRMYFVRGKPRPKPLEMGGMVVSLGAMALVKLTQAVDGIFQAARSVIGVPPPAGTVTTPAAEARSPGADPVARRDPSPTARAAARTAS